MIIAADTYPSLEVSFFSGLRPRAIRPPHAFAREEIKVTTGPAKGENMNPWMWQDLVLAEIWNPRWKYVWMTGGVQSSKTFMGLAADVLYALFELEEDVGLAAPTIDLGWDVFVDKILPTIMATRYKNLIPKTGKGAKLGKSSVLRFANGARLYFFGAGGGDSQRSSHTVRIVVLTELDKMDKPGEASRETDPVSQIEARTTTYGPAAKLIGECTVSIEEGRIWREITGGTDSRVMLQCPHCREYVWPERKHFTGWEEAETVMEARENGRFSCPECGAIWQEDSRAHLYEEPELWRKSDRAWAIEHAAIVHKGQSISKTGRITGEPPRTNSLGIRWTGLHSPLNPQAEIAAKEWAARRSEKDEDEKYCRQFIWAIPYEPEVDDSGISAGLIQNRLSHYPRGIIPPECSMLTAGIDLGKYACHWEVKAISGDAKSFVIDYGVLEVHNTEQGEDEGLDHALLTALYRWREDVLAEPYKTADGIEIPLSKVLIDAHWRPDPVLHFCAEVGDVYQPSMGCGRGVNQPNFNMPPVRTFEKKPGHHMYELRKTVKVSGEKRTVWQVMFEADYWKRYVHDRYLTPPACPGSCTIFGDDRKQHLAFSKHQVAEIEVEEFKRGKGVVRFFKKENKNNHWLDTSVLCDVGGGHRGIRLIGSNEEAEPASNKSRDYFSRRQDRRGKR
ncbi:MAG: phage terminase large subunit family protein [Planctomycetes bacterium]|nr:phage terminase large subunit family protein [Planctomycetota bacterium]